MKNWTTHPEPSKMSSGAQKMKTGPDALVIVENELGREKK
jgi:hypothetical protein